MIVYILSTNLAAVERMLSLYSDMLASARKFRPQATDDGDEGHAAVVLLDTHRQSVPLLQLWRPLNRPSAELFQLRTPDWRVASNSPPRASLCCFVDRTRSQGLLAVLKCTLSHASSP